MEQLNLEIVGIRERGSGISGNPVFEAELADGTTCAIRPMDLSPGDYLKTGEANLARVVEAYGAGELPGLALLLIPVGYQVVEEAEGRRVEVIYPLMDEDLHSLSRHTPDDELMKEVAALSKEDMVAFLADSSAAVDALHELGFVHRDLKQKDNYLYKEGRFYLADFHLVQSNPNGHLSEGERIDYLTVVQGLLLELELTVEMHRIRMRRGNPREIIEFSDQALIEHYGEAVYEVFQDFKSGRIQTYSEFARLLIERL